MSGAGAGPGPPLGSLARYGEPQATFTARNRRGAQQPFVPGTISLCPHHLLWAPTTPGVELLEVKYNQIEKHVQSKAAPNSKPFLKLVVSKEHPFSSSFVFEFVTSEDRSAFAAKLVRALADAKEGKTFTLSDRKGETRSDGAAIQPEGTPLSDAAATNLEMQSRISLLQADSNLFQLHSKLVGRGLLTEEDFWTVPERVHLVQAEQRRLQLQHRKRQKEGDSSKAAEGDPLSIGEGLDKQVAGLPNAMVSDLRVGAEVQGTTNTTGGQGTVRVRLTQQQKLLIFSERPEVRRAYKTHVPKLLTEAEFWTKFVRSEYLRKGRRARSRRKLAELAEAQQRLTKEQRKTMTAMVDGPLPEDLAEDEELFQPTVKEMKTTAQNVARKALHVDPSINLSAMVSDGVVGGASYGYGLHRDGAKVAQVTGMITHDGGEGDQREDGLAATNSGFNELTHHINRHAEVVLAGVPNMANDTETDTERRDAEGCQLETKAYEIDAQLAAVEGDVVALAESMTYKLDRVSDTQDRTQGLAGDAKARHEREMKDVVIEELTRPADPHYDVLSIDNPSRYFDQLASASGDGGSKPSEADALAVSTPPLALPAIARDSDSVRRDVTVTSTTSMRIMQELEQNLHQKPHHEGRLLGVNRLGTSSSDAINVEQDGRTSELRAEVESEKAPLLELLRLYWGSVQAWKEDLTNMEAKKRTERLQAALSSRYDHLQQRKQEYLRSGVSMASSLIQPLIELLDAVFEFDEKSI
mmetsp:Transcript_10695/g.39265  ORF Transcript_10695/g.39265 Transcript_10695/m.39265 type:complete len:753 (-) Transcript_10695:563-2821(-)